jgi:hypothetical protein
VSGPAHTIALVLLTTTRVGAPIASDPRSCEQPLTAAEMDAMTPQQRADAVDASIVHRWDEVDPVFRRRVEQRAADLAKTLGADA